MKDIMKSLIGVLFFCFLFWVENGSAAIRLKNWIGGKVSETYFTHRDVQADYLIEQIVFMRSQPSQIVLLSGKEKTYFNQVNNVLLEKAIEIEAKAFEVDQVQSSDINQTLLQVKSRANKDLAEIQMSDEELITMITRKLRAKRFIDFKSKSTYAVVSDEEASQYFEQNRIKFGHMPFESFKIDIKNFLASKKRKERLLDWFEILKKKHNIQNFFVKIED